LCEGPFPTKGVKLLGKKNTRKIYPGWREDGRGDSDFKTRGQTYKVRANGSESQVALFDLKYPSLLHFLPFYVSYQRKKTGIFPGRHV
jgi:hypothetical protein